MVGCGDDGLVVCGGRVRAYVAGAQGLQISVLEASPLAGRIRGVNQDTTVTSSESDLACGATTNNEEHHFKNTNNIEVII